MQPDSGQSAGDGRVPQQPPSAASRAGQPVPGDRRRRPGDLELAIRRFFVVVTLPFAADDELLEFSARQHGVLWTPMCHFYDGTGGRHQARLACSQLTPQLIETGLDRFAALVADPRSRAAEGG